MTGGYECLFCGNNDSAFWEDLEGLSVGVGIALSLDWTLESFMVVFWLLSFVSNHVTFMNRALFYLS